MHTTIDPLAGCPHAPGTPGKVAWLERRAACQLPLFNDLDAVDCRRRGHRGSGHRSVIRPTPKGRSGRTPAGVYARKLAEVARLTTAGVSIRVIARLLGVSHSNVMQLRRRLRRVAV